MEVIVKYSGLAFSPNPGGFQIRPILEELSATFELNLVKMHSIVCLMPAGVVITDREATKFAGGTIRAR
jgi:hypothetical protein